MTIIVECGRKQRSKLAGDRAECECWMASKVCSGVANDVVDIAFVDRRTGIH